MVVTFLVITFSDLSAAALSLPGDDNSRMVPMEEVAESGGEPTVRPTVIDTEPTATATPSTDVITTSTAYSNNSHVDCII